MYCSVADLEALIGRHRVSAWGDVARVEQAIKQASAEIDSYLISAGYSLPLASVADYVRVYAVDLAVYNLAAAHGLTDDPADKALIDKATAARHYFRGVASGKYKLHTPSVGELGSGDEQALGNGGGYVVSAVHKHLDLRGYHG